MSSPKSVDAILESLNVPTNWHPNPTKIAQIQDMFKRATKKKGKKVKVYDSDHYAYIISHTDKYDKTFRSNVLNFWYTSYTRSPNAKATPIALSFLFKYLIEGETGNASASSSSASTSSSAKSDDSNVRKRIENLLITIASDWSLTTGAFVDFLVALLQNYPNMQYHREVFTVVCLELQDSRSSSDINNMQTVMGLLKNHIEDDGYVEQALGLFAVYLDPQYKSIITALVPLLIQLSSLWQQRGSVNHRVSSLSFDIISYAIKWLSPQEKAAFFTKEYIQAQAKSIIKSMQGKPLADVKNDVTFFSQLVAEKLVPEEVINEFYGEALKKFEQIVDDPNINKTMESGRAYTRLGRRTVEEEEEDEDEDEEEGEETAEGEEEGEEQQNNGDDDVADEDEGFIHDLDEDDRVLSDPFARIVDSLQSLSKMIDASEECLRYFAKYMETHLTNESSSKSQKLVGLLIWASLINAARYESVKLASQFSKNALAVVKQVLSEDDSILLIILSVFDSYLQYYHTSLGRANVKGAKPNIEDTVWFIEFALMKMDKFITDHADDPTLLTLYFNTYSAILTNRIVTDLQVSLECGKAIHSIIQKGMEDNGALSEPLLILESFGQVIPYKIYPELQDMTMAILADVTEDPLDFIFELNSCIQTFVKACGKSLKTEYIDQLFEIITNLFDNEETAEEDAALFSQSLAVMVNTFPEEIEDKLSTPEMIKALKAMKQMLSEECAEFFVAVAKNYFHKSTPEVFRAKKLTLSIFERVVQTFPTVPELSRDLGRFIEYLPKSLTEQYLEAIVLGFKTILDMGESEEDYNWAGIMPDTNEFVPGVPDVFAVARVVNAFPEFMLSRLDKIFKSWMTTMHSFLKSLIVVVTRNAEQRAVLISALLLIPQSQYFQELISSSTSSEIPEALVNYTRILLLMPALTVQQKYQVCDILLQIKRSSIGGEYWKRFLTQIVETQLVSRYDDIEAKHFNDDVRSRIEERLTEYMSLIPRLKRTQGFSDMIIICTDRQQQQQ